MSKPWFRLYAEFLSDPKMQLLAFEDQRHYVGVLCLKCNGTLETLSIGPEHFERMVAKALGLDPATGAEVKRRLMDVGLIGESWQPLAWEKRQYESDSSTSRVHKWRDQRTRNVSETLLQRSRTDSEQIQNRTDTEQSKRAREPRPVPRKRCPEEFQITDDLRAWAKLNAPDVDTDRETSRMRDWEYKTGRSDWPAAWRTWMDRAQSDSANRPGRKPTRKPKTADELDAEWEAANAGK